MNARTTDIRGVIVDEDKLHRRLAEFDLMNAPGHLLRRNHQRSYEIFTRWVGDDVTRQQMALMIALAKHPGASQRDLVDATGIDKSTLKEMLGRMVAKGWVNRKRDPNDSRAWTMVATRMGEEIIADRLDAVDAAQKEIVAPLPDEYRAIFIKSLRILVGLEE